MDTNLSYKRIKAPTNTTTHNPVDFFGEEGNIYETVAVMGVRANQITREMKEDLQHKLEEFGVQSNTLDEETENREQVEISRHFERMPKPALMAEAEFLAGDTHFHYADHTATPRGNR